ncbi:MAG: hypothetical protein K8R40_09500 [Anaerolineaceae bacterium]|nr:hypothetical protein [Anaerolineaceae bacterium]
MSSISSKQVIDNLLRNKPSPRMGLIGSPWQDTYVKWVKQGYPTKMVLKHPGDTRWNPDDGNWLDVTEAGEYVEPVPAWQHFNYDMVGVGPWFDYHPAVDHDVIIEENDEWAIHENGSGAHLKYWKHKMGTPEHISFKMTTRKIWEEVYRPQVVEWNPDRIKIPQIKTNFQEAVQSNKWVHMGHQFIWENMRQSMGDITLYESLLLDPDWIHDYNRVYTDLYKKAFKHLFDNIGLPHGIWLYEDLGYKNGLFASPRVFRKLIFPYYKEMVDFFHDYDLPVVLHSCGSVAQAMPLIVETGFDALNPIERKADNNDPYVFAKEFGDKLAFIGGLDVRILETNDKTIIISETLALINDMKDTNGRLVLCEDHSLPPTIELSSYQWMLDTFWENCAY